MDSDPLMLAKPPLGVDSPLKDPNMVLTDLLLALADQDTVLADLVGMVHPWDPWDPIGSGPSNPNVENYTRIWIASCGIQTESLSYYKGSGHFTALRH